MTILQSLDGYYDRMAARGEVAAPGYSPGKISFAIVLKPDGTVATVTDLRVQSGKKLVPQQITVPAEVKRTVGISPNLLWDKTAYVLGRTAGSGKRTADEHAAFRQKHLELLANGTDAGLTALRKFLETWTPARFDDPPFTPEMLDTNIVFALEGENGYLHDRPAAQALLAAQTGDAGWETFCLVTGRKATVARLHPSIKGVDGAQSSGASLVSFNQESFTSYGKVQGDNAPVSEAAAFRYGTALNRLLDRAHGNRIKIGDTVIVYWADTSDTEKEDAAAEAEDFFAQMLSPPDDETEAAKLRGCLEALKAGRPLREVNPQLPQTARFHILGLAPNAARLSVRFWLTDDFEVFAKRLAKHYDNLVIEPTPWKKTPSVQRLLVKTTAAQEKFENIPPFLSGEVTRAVLTGAPYPYTLLSAALMRVRAGDDASTGWHAAAAKAVLSRIYLKEEIPVSLARDNIDPAYLTGRLFAVLETAQRFALGGVNATIRDRYFASASATPAGIFPVLLRGAQNHLAKLRKEKPGMAVVLEREIENIVDGLGADFPHTLKLEDQGRFVIGYYHQRKGQFAGKETEAEAAEEHVTEGEDHE